MLVFLWNVWRLVGFWRLVLMGFLLIAVTSEVEIAILVVQNLSLGRPGRPAKKCGG